MEFHTVVCINSSEWSLAFRGVKFMSSVIIGQGMTECSANLKPRGWRGNYC